MSSSDSVTSKNAPSSPVKYIIITGGVISGIGKGLTSSSIGTLLRSFGFSVTAIKIDPYLNIDAGTFSPYEHGETFVLDDGAEVDLDLGNYERFMDIKLSAEHNITTGKVYERVIKRERAGDYLGKTVQVIPHITDEIIKRIQTVAQDPSKIVGIPPQICLIEVGGVVGDIESAPFIEALRQFTMKLEMNDYCHVHMSLIISTKGNEQKTKPTQMNVRTLRGLGLVPDLLICRHSTPLFSETKEKVAMFCNVLPSHVVSMHDCPSIYQVPMLLQNEGAIDIIVSKLKLNVNSDMKSNLCQTINQWNSLANTLLSSPRSIRIALVGKYVKQSDSYHSVTKALQHACAAHHVGIDIQWIDSDDLTKSLEKDDDAWTALRNAEGILVPGGFGIRGTEGKILAIEYARTHNIPFLGICYGMQLAVIEICRNVLQLKNASSAEYDPNPDNSVIIEMSEFNPCNMKGASMRLGSRRSVFRNKDCTSYKLYGCVDYVNERHRHRFEVNPAYVDQIESQSKLRFVATDDLKQRMEICEYLDHKFFLGVQFHPEFLSRPFNPSPCFTGFIKACCI